MRGMWRLYGLLKRFVPKAIILIYHRVAELPADPQLLCVSPKHFAEHLEVLRRHYRPLSLRSLRSRMALNLWHSRSVVITFDDGYTDNLHYARPLLESFDIPATMFVVAGKVDSVTEFWWDELERVMLSAPQLPDQLSINISGRVYRWDMHWSDEDDSPSSNWHILMKSKPTPRQLAYRELAALLRGMESDARQYHLEQLEAWAGLDANARPDYRAFSSDEVRVMVKDDLVEIGAHTITHPVLSALPIKEQETEIVNSKLKLEKVLGQAVNSFSYPYGTRDDYTADTVRIIRDVGFDCACSNFPGQVTFDSDPYQLPRLLVRDWDGEEFARRLRGWFPD